jgi:hypothetical protein
LPKHFYWLLFTSTFIARFYLYTSRLDLHLQVVMGFKLYTVKFMNWIGLGSYCISIYFKLKFIKRPNKLWKDIWIIIDYHPYIDDLPTKVSTVILIYKKFAFWCSLWYTPSISKKYAFWCSLWYTPSISVYKRIRLGFKDQ